MTPPRSRSPPGWRARPRRRPAAQLPVMAALVESNLKNVNFGDADSLGYFQMRVEHLGPGLPRLRRRPAEADRLVPRHRRARQGPAVARGQSIDDPSQFGEWIADVERPAEQYRGRYQLRSTRPTASSRRPTRRRPRPPPRPRRGRRRPTAPPPPAMAQGAGPRRSPR